MTDRLTLALPIDVARQFDHTVTQTQLESNTFQGTADDRGVLAGHIEDAEDEFRQRADLATAIAREGVPGDPETYERRTHKVKGHEAFKASWSRSARDYRPTEVEVDLDHGRVLPIDPAEGDEVRIYRGMGGSTADAWEDVTDAQGDVWDIVDHRAGTLVLHPAEIHRATRRNRQGIGVTGGQRKVRVAVCYRHGGLGRGRSLIRSTELAAGIDDTETGGVAVDDVEVFPVGVAGGSLVLLIGEEYVTATADHESGEITIQERGVRGTDAAGHDSGDRVQYVPPSVRKAVAARAGMALIQAGRYSAWLPDADDEVGKSDMLAELRDTWETTLAAVGE